MAMREMLQKTRAFTLIELLLVAGLIVVLSMLVLPSLARQIKGEELPASANHLRSLLTVVSAHAAFDSKRYRIRFPREDETDPFGGTTQPIIEREDDPIHNPEIFLLVTDPWVNDATFIGEVRCAEVRLGRPSMVALQERRDQAAEEVKEATEDRGQAETFEHSFPPLYVEADGTTEWAAFLLTSALPEVSLGELIGGAEEYEQIEVILEGETGIAWLQRPFYDDELDLFEDRNWPAVLRQDFLRKQPLTERDVLELRDIRVGK
jgi:type II secretory pathway pseudopilin PulG